MTTPALRGPAGRLRRRRRRQLRLRRTVLVAMVLVLAATAFSRWREDHGGAVAVGETLEVPATRTDALVPAVTGRPGPPPDGKSPAAPADHADTDDALAGAPPGDPAPASVPTSGSGQLTSVDIPQGPRREHGRTVTFGVDVEEGLPVNAAEFAAVVRAVLTDDRGWQTQDDVRFVPVGAAERTSGAQVAIRVTLASPSLTAQLCAPLNTSVQQVSCWNGSQAVLNLTRWMRGAQTYGSDLASYRQYLVSHEVGHGLGHGHASCSAPDRPAGVMVQQTKSLEGCTAWPWPTRP